jgi:hypothetical protein
MDVDLALENQAMKDLIEKCSRDTGETGSGQVHDRTSRTIGGPRLWLHWTVWHCFLSVTC